MQLSLSVDHAFRIQHGHSATFAAVVRQLGPIEQLQASTAAELDVLLPSVLALAFKGKL